MKGLSVDDIGKKFKRQDGRVVTMVSHHKSRSMFLSSCGDVQLNKHDGRHEFKLCCSLRSRVE